MHLEEEEAFCGCDCKGNSKMERKEEKKEKRKLKTAKKTQERKAKKKEKQIGTAVLLPSSIPQCLKRVVSDHPTNG